MAWEKAQLTRPTTWYNVKGPLIQAATELDPENGFSWVVNPSAKYAIKCVSTRDDYDNQVEEYYRNGHVANPKTSLLGYIAQRSARASVQNDVKVLRGHYKSLKKKK
jgi:hypothetical protein